MIVDVVVVVFAVTMLSGIKFYHRIMAYFNDSRCQKACHHHNQCLVFDCFVCAVCCQMKHWQRIVSHLIVVKLKLIHSQVIQPFSFCHFAGQSSWPHMNAAYRIWSNDVTIDTMRTANNNNIQDSSENKTGKQWLKLSTVIEHTFYRNE